MVSLNLLLFFVNFRSKFTFICDWLLLWRVNVLQIMQEAFIVKIGGQKAIELTRHVRLLPLNLAQKV